MPLDESFPLHLLPLRAQAAILNEFGGRHPSVQEVASIPDTHWLATPSIGTSTLRKIRALTRSEDSVVAHVGSQDLLKRLTVLQEEIKVIQRTIRMGIEHRSLVDEPFQG